MGRFSIVFDLDGVIIDSINVQKKAFYSCLEKIENKHDVSFCQFLEYSGSSLENIFKALKLPQELISYYREISTNSIHEIKLFDGIVDFITELKSKNYNCAVCTGKERKRTIEILEYKKIDHLFNTVVCSDEVQNPKPYPDSLILAMDRMNAKSQDCIMIGDAKNDILCAKGANVMSIGVTWGEQESNIFDEVKPNKVANNIIELRKHVYSLL